MHKLLVPMTNSQFPFALRAWLSEEWKCLSGAIHYFQVCQNVGHILWYMVHQYTFLHVCFCLRLFWKEKREGKTSNGADAKINFAHGVCSVVHAWWVRIMSGVLGYFPKMQSWIILWQSLFILNYNFLFGFNETHIMQVVCQCRVKDDEIMSKQ